MDEHVERLVDALAHIELYPERWEQGHWGGAEVASEGNLTLGQYVSDEVVQQLPACKSSFCLAGWLCHLAGETIWERDYAGSFTMALRQGGRICYRANELLGLPRGLNDGGAFNAEGEADLFSGAHALSDLYEISASQLHIDEELLRKQVQERMNDIAFTTAELPKEA